jgi:hypothetical protein
MKGLNWSFSSLGFAILAAAIGWGCSESSEGEETAAAAGGQAGDTTSGVGGEMSAGTSGSGGSGATATPKALWDYVGIVGTGQSLSVGAEAGAITAKATMQPYNNMKLSLGTATTWPINPDDAALSLVALTEPIRPTANNYPSAYPRNMYGESPHTAMAAQITALARLGGLSDMVTVHTAVGESGQGMTWINKTAMEEVMANGAQTRGRAYAATLFEARAIKRLVGDKTYGIGAIFLTHGESDAGNTGYGQAMVQLWTDYNADLKAITGQTESIPLITSQQHGVYPYMAGEAPRNVDTSTLLQWRAALDNPDKIVCAGPKYPYPAAADFLHMQPLGYEMLGEKYAQVFYQHVVLGQPWHPLQPLTNTVARNGRVITVDFDVPVPPLTWDDALPRPHQTALTEWAAGRGFEVRMGATRLAIESVEIVDEDTVQITCAADVPAGVTLGYAGMSDGAAVAGVFARWGQLKDSDPFVGDFTQKPLPNYSVTFELPVP